MNENPFQPPFSYKRLAASIARDLDLEPRRVLGRKRDRPHTHARAVLIHFLMDRGWSASRIGRALGRDHSTILFARDNLPVYLGYYPEALETYERHRALREEARNAL